MGAAPSSLTGVWYGLYTYPGGLGSVSFGATLIEAGNSLSGSTHEPCIFGDCTTDTLYATLLGNRRDTAVTFVKTYDGTGGWAHSVNYAGS